MSARARAARWWRTSSHAAGLRVVVLEEGGYFTHDDFVGPPFDRVQRIYRNGGATVALGRPAIPVPLGKCVGGTTVINSGPASAPPIACSAPGPPTRVVDAADRRRPWRRSSTRSSAPSASVPCPWEIIGRNAELFDRGVRALGLAGTAAPAQHRRLPRLRPVRLRLPERRQAGDAPHLPARRLRRGRTSLCSHAGRAGAHRARRRGRRRRDRPRPRDGRRARSADVRAPLVVVAAGTLHTPELLARSGVRHPGARPPSPSPSRRRRRGLLRASSARLARTLQSYLVDHLDETHGVMIEVTNPVPGVSAAALPGVGPTLKEGLARFPSRCLGRSVRVRHRHRPGAPLPGLRDPLLTYRLAPADARSLDAGIAPRRRDLLRRRRGGRVHRASPGCRSCDIRARRRRSASGTHPAAALMPTGFHPMGTARMGGDPARAPHRQLGRGTRRDGPPGRRRKSLPYLRRREPPGVDHGIRDAHRAAGGRRRPVSRPAPLPCHARRMTIARRDQEVPTMMRFPRMLVCLLAIASSGRADETCMSPYLPKITGQEDYVYVWTLGVEGVGDGSDKLVTVGANPDARRPTARCSRRSRSAAATRRTTPTSPTTAATSGRAGSTTARSGSSTSPPIRTQPKLVRTIDTFVKDSGGVVGPHTFFALPGRMLITGALQRQGQGRPHGARRVQQRRPVRAHDLAARRRPVRLRRARRSRGSTACSRRRSPAGTTTCATSAS